MFILEPWSTYNTTLGQKVNYSVIKRERERVICPHSSLWPGGVLQLIVVSLHNWSSYPAPPDDRHEPDLH